MYSRRSSATLHERRGAVSITAVRVWSPFRKQHRMGYTDRSGRATVPIPISKAAPTVVAEAATGVGAKTTPLCRRETAPFRVGKATAAAGTKAAAGRLAEAASGHAVVLAPRALIAGPGVGVRAHPRLWLVGVPPPARAVGAPGRGPVGPSRRCSPIAVQQGHVSPRDGRGARRRRWDAVRSGWRRCAVSVAWARRVGRRGVDLVRGGGGDLLKAGVGRSSRGDDLGRKRVVLHCETRVDQREKVDEISRDVRRKYLLKMVWKSLE